MENYCRSNKSTIAFQQIPERGTIRESSGSGALAAPRHLRLALWLPTYQLKLLLSHYRSFVVAWWAPGTKAIPAEAFWAHSSIRWHNLNFLQWQILDYVSKITTPNIAADKYLASVRVRCKNLCFSSAKFFWKLLRTSITESTTVIFSCKSLVYFLSGCGGNANRFMRRTNCRNRCVKNNEKKPEKVTQTFTKKPGVIDRISSVSWAYSIWQKEQNIRSFLKWKCWRNAAVA